MNKVQKSEILQQEYSLRFDGLEDYRMKMWKIFCKDFFQHYVGSDSRILDVGAGYGEFIRNICAKDKFAMDLNPHMREIYEKNNIHFLEQDCTTQWNLEGESLDIVFSSNFLEHLHTKRDVEFVLDEAHRVLKTKSNMVFNHNSYGNNYGGGGVIILLGPNIRFVYDEYWDFWDHLIPMSDRSVREVLRMKGFRIIECIDRFLPYAMSGEGRKITPPFFFIQLYLKIPLVWKFLGKQFFIVAEKI